MGPSIWSGEQWQAGGLEKKGKRDILPQLPYALLCSGDILVCCSSCDYLTLILNVV